MSTFNVEKQYAALVSDILQNGDIDDDRTGTGTISTVGPQIKQTAEDGIRRIHPVLRGKRVFIAGVIHELIWMISGDTNIKYLNDNGVHIWDEWAAPEDEYIDGDRLCNYDRMVEYAKRTNRQVAEVSKQFRSMTTTASCHKIMDDAGVPTHKRILVRAKGDLGPVYGAQWRNCDGVDQLQVAIDNLRNNPSSRRSIVSSWNVRDLDKMALTPCHMMFHFISKPAKDKYKKLFAKTYPDAEIPDRILHLVMYQRSSDTFLGLPFNMLFYSLLNTIVADQTGHMPGSITYDLGDAHVYLNHTSQAIEYLKRYSEQVVPEMDTWEDTSISINNSVEDIDLYEFSDFTVHKYVSLPVIKAPISI